MYGRCKCGHSQKDHKYWREDGFNSGECLIRRCPCVVYDDEDWDDEEDPEEETVEVEESDWDLI
jgi:hypothetical protein